MVNVLATMQSRMCDSLSDQLHHRGVGLREMVRRTANSARLLAGSFEVLDQPVQSSSSWNTEPAADIRTGSYSAVLSSNRISN